MTVDAIVDRKIQFIDLNAQLVSIRPQIDAAIKRVLDHGMFIMGPEVQQLEATLAEYCGVKHAITCANGTDAIGLVLMAANIGTGDAVFVPSFTFAATAEVVAWVGATPVFVDSLPDTYNMDPASLEKAIQKAIKLGLKPKCVIPVDLFGQPADYASIQAIADAHKLLVIGDAAQSFGAKYNDKRVGSLCAVTTTSFFPAKPLGCFGDGGAIFTDSDEMAAVIKSMRVHGQGTDKYDNVRIGMNARLDTIQAAILIEKLKVFPKELISRQQIANKYNAGLQQYVQIPVVLPNATSAWAQYTVCLPEKIDRSQLIADLKAKGIPSMIYYVKPLHLQTAYKHYPRAEESLAICEHLSNVVLSLPMSGYVTSHDAEYIVGCVGSGFGM